MVRDLDVSGPLDGAAIEAALADASPRECRWYDALLFRRAEQETARGAPQRASQFEFLGHVTSMHLVPGNPHEPLRPFAELADRRSAMPSDLTDRHLELLDAVVDSIGDLELRARILDLLWLRRRDAGRARQAVEAYLESAAHLGPERWHSCAERLERGFRLALLLGRDGPCFTRTARLVEEFLGREDVRRLPHLCAAIMAVLAEHDVGDADQLGTLASELAETSEREGRLDWARQLWELAAGWHRRRKAEEECERALLRAAETFVKLAAARKRSALVESHFLRQALEALRRLAGTRERQRALYARLRDAQKRAVSEMRPLKVESDASEMIAMAEKMVGGKELRDALLALAFEVRPQDYGKLREAAVEHQTQYPLQGLFAASFLDVDGKILAEAPPRWPGSQDDEGRSLWLDVVQLASMGHSVCVQGIIEPARQRILREHWITEGNLWPLLNHSAFIPEDRRLTYLLGLAAGFRGDFVTSMHLLVPQVENSLRVLLQRSGVETSVLRSTGIQEELQLGTLLERAAESGVLTEDLAFELQALLLERSYANLRNRVAHGLAADAELQYSPASSYLWWLILHLCLATINRPEPLEQTFAAG